MPLVISISAVGGLVMALVYFGIFFSFLSGENVVAELCHKITVGFDALNEALRP
jgi:hypothetical protein